MSVQPTDLQTSVNLWLNPAQPATFGSTLGPSQGYSSANKPVKSLEGGTSSPGCPLHRIEESGTSSPGCPYHRIQESGPSSPGCPAYGYTLVESIFSICRSSRRIGKQQNSSNFPTSCLTTVQGLESSHQKGLRKQNQMPHPRLSRCSTRRQQCPVICVHRCQVRGLGRLSSLT